MMYYNDGKRNHLHDIESGIRMLACIISAVYVSAGMVNESVMNMLFGLFMAELVKILLNTWDDHHDKTENKS